MFVYLQMIETPEERSKFESIYLLYRDTMYAVAYRILQNPQDAEDTVHHTFLKILENLSKISEIDCPKTKGYIVTIVENRAIDIYRRKKAHPTVPYDEKNVGTTVAYDGSDALAECILKLSPRQRNLLILRYHHGYELKEVAKMLGITYSNALTIEKRAKKKLKTICEEAEMI